MFEWETKITDKYVELSLMINDYQAAKTILEALSVKTIGQDMVLAKIYQQLGEIKKCIAQYKQVLK